MKIISEMLSVTKKWELCVLKAYKDNDGSWHVGYGHGNAAGVLPFVTEETVLKDEEEASRILMDDLAYLVPILDKMIKVELNPYQYGALLDIAYNRGPGRLRESAVMRWINDTTDKYSLKKAARAMVINEPGFEALNTAQDKVTGEVREFLGLTLRRIDDASLFLTKK
jgi:GH24 family phage-related lysozyme (muramidase)